MESKLNKVKHNFGKIKDIRVAVANIFNTLEVKITKLKSTTNDFIKNNHETLFVFGLDSFMFQSKMIDYEYSDMQKYFLALNNRMYCEYYKLYKLVLEYIEQNSGISQNKTFEMIKANSKFPVYKDLEPYKQYSFETIEEVHKTIISLLNIINDYIVLKDAELENFKMKQYSGFNINNFVNTFDFNIVIIKQKLSLFMSYLEFFHNIHTKHFKRFSKKMKLMDDYINDDIQFDDSPRRKVSRDFDDTSSENSSTGKNSGIIDYETLNMENEKPVHKAVPRRSMLKKGVDSVISGINSIKAFGGKGKQKSDADLTHKQNKELDSISENSVQQIITGIGNNIANNIGNNIGNNIDDNVNLIISETNSVISEAELNEENIALLSQEKSELINEQLNKDPNLVSKMFDELTKTFDEDEKKSVKSTSSRGSRKSVKKELVEEPIIKEAVAITEIQEVTEVEEENEQDQGTNVTSNGPNKKNKRKGKKK